MAITSLKLTDTFNVLLTRINEIITKVNGVNVDASTLTINLATDSSTEPLDSSIDTNTGTLYLTSTGALKLKYKISTNPVATVTVSGGGAGSISTITLGDSSVTVTDTGTDGNIALQTDGTVRWNLTSAGHILPQAHEAYDLGSADKKVRHLFLSDNSLWIGDQHKMDIEGGKLKFRKRKTNKVPKKILDEHTAKNEATHTADAKTHSGKTNLSDMKLEHWLAYAKSLGGSLASADVKDIFPANVTYKDDYEEISTPSQPGQDKLPPVNGVDTLTLDLKQGNTALIKSPSGDIGINIVGALAASGDPEGAYFDATIHVHQGATTRTLDLAALKIDGVNLPVGHRNFLNTPSLQANKISTFKISAIYDGAWYASVLGYPQ